MNPERHIKGWGFEDWIVNNELYCGKILHFDKGKKCSLHYHKLKDETFYILKGKIKLKLNDKEIVLKKGETIRLIPKTNHQIIALENTDIIEISTHHFESDSYRIEKGD